MANFITKLSELEELEKKATGKVATPESVASFAVLSSEIPFLLKSCREMHEALDRIACNPIVGGQGLDASKVAQQLLSRLDEEAGG